MANLLLLHHLLEQASAATPDREAVVDLVGSRRSFAYRTLHAMASHCAAVLREQGLERGDRVAIYLPKSVQESLRRPWQVASS
jgi:acyl-CoA synthetase (AMP-forming)/AMP-acid ligase II